jgi:hypothetical protein
VDRRNAGRGRHVLCADHVRRLTTPVATATVTGPRRAAPRDNGGWCWLSPVAAPSSGLGYQRIGGASVPIDHSEATDKEEDGLYLYNRATASVARSRLSNNGNRVRVSGDLADRSEYGRRQRRPRSHLQPADIDAFPESVDDHGKGDHRCPGPQLVVIAWRLDEAICIGFGYRSSVT